MTQKVDFAEKKGVARNRKVVFRTATKYLYELWQLFVWKVCRVSFLGEVDLGHIINIQNHADKGSFSGPEGVGRNRTRCCLEPRFEKNDYRHHITAPFKCLMLRKLLGIGSDIKILQDPFQIVEKKMLWLAPQGVGRNRESQKSVITNAKPHY